jgi:hypothetical protein
MVELVVQGGGYRDAVVICRETSSCVISISRCGSGVRDIILYSSAGQRESERERAA